MKLYYSPGACSLSPHIVLREAGLAFEPVLASTKTHKLQDGTDYYGINPKGYVPLLELDDGQRLTEGPAIVQYIADQAPDRQLAPANGTMVNVMLRPGFFVAGMPFNEVMTLVDDEYQIFALYGQNELHQVEPHNEAEITLDTYPGRVIKAHVDSVIWAQGQGQLEASGDLPKTTFVPPPGRFPVKLVVADADKAVFLAAGARGAAAIYTEHLAIIHIIRKVLLRVQSYFDYVIIKHGISLGH